MAKLTKKMKNRDEISLPLIDQKKENVVPEDFVFIDCSNKDDLKSFYICKHPVTQKEFEDIMGINPSYFQMSNTELKKEEMEQLKKEKNSENNPVETVSWYDVIFYCNKRSVREGLNPVYSVDGMTDVDQWGYEPCSGQTIFGRVRERTKANGFRLPKEIEWEYAEKGGENFKYTGSDDINEVAWYSENSNGVSHPVMQKKPNGYGLFDMSGNVWEWCWDTYAFYSMQRGSRGGAWDNNKFRFLDLDIGNSCTPSNRYNCMGFRLIRTATASRTKK